MFGFIQNFNTLSDTSYYKYTFYSLGIVVFIMSFLINHLKEKPCKNGIALIISIVHHFSIYFIYFGFLAPADKLWAFSLLVGLTVLSWILYDNYCILTVFENMLCNRNINYVFRDITFYMPKPFDKLLSSIRIYLVGFMFLVIVFRLYFYYKTKKIEIQGHRGARGNYPENSLPGFKYALDNNIDVLELDLQLTKDNEVIIYHDKTINPNICVSSGLGSGFGGNQSIKNLTLQEIKAYDCGSKQNPDFPDQIPVPNTHIPTFKELLDMIYTNYYYKNIKFNVEIKTEKELDTDQEVKQFVDEVVTIIHNYGLTNSMTIQSFDSRALKYVKQIDPYIKTSYLIEEVNIDDNVVFIAKDLGVQIISPDYSLLNKDNVLLLHKNGFEVFPWTVNDISDFKRMIEYDVDGVITDYPKVMKDFIDSN